MRSKKWVSANNRGRTSRRRQKDFRFHNPNYAKQRSEEGRLLERRVTDVLAKMKEFGEIRKFIQHLPNSPEDHQGKDFTITFGNFFLPVSFGVTCSFISYKKYFQEHPGLECLWIASDQSDEEIRQIINGLIARLETI